MATGCGRFRGFLHARKRRFDRRFAWPALQRVSTDARSFLDAWELFKSMPGQEHWRCACARSERALRVLELVEEAQRDVDL